MALRRGAARLFAQALRQQGQCEVPVLQACGPSVAAVSEGCVPLLPRALKPERGSFYIPVAEGGGPHDRSFALGGVRQASQLAGVPSLCGLVYCGTL